MSDFNPYQPPAASLTVEIDVHQGALLAEPRVVAVGRSWIWITEGFNLFKQAPWLWIGMVVSWMLLMMVMAFIPLVGSLATNLLAPVFSGGFMLACAALARGEDMEFSHLFAGFQNHFGKLIVVGGLYLVGMMVISIVVMVVFFVIFGAAMMSGLSGMEAMNSEAEVFTAVMLGLLAFLVIMALMLPMMMAYWFAPVLVVLHDMDAIEAMKKSFVGCLRNWWPFLVYGLIATGLALLAVIPLGLGFLVLSPVLMATMYTAYKDIFLAEEPAA